ncbi:pyridoxal phosphate-dependent transferase [Apiospora phragmitis]|uniref:Pyridoxal phosphate-dependent transferase n=1 Tax=Apiospora phragmitis TaxID=2905665 RepID=A0ABR1TUM0_9PEZI
MENEYNQDVEAIRPVEYPHMNDGVYLDHSGATIYAKSAVEGFTRKMLSNLYGNPHSENSPAKLSGENVDRIREKALTFLGADPAHFDLVFVANATAAIKLVADSFRDLAEKTKSGRFWYGFHKDAHTSLVGVRELTYGYHHCFGSDYEVEEWLQSQSRALAGRHSLNDLGLFAYPGQSNMTGRRLPPSWCGRIRQSATLQNCYTLFDAAALAMTSPMELVFGDPDQAPDFTCLSLYKIFGFPDLGALVVRKDSGHILTLRKYFGGGTVTMISTLSDPWHKIKGLQAPNYHIHDGLEDGTLPFHSIIALGEAIDVHKKLYVSMKTVSKHTSYLLARLYRGLSEIRHPNGAPACRIYNENRCSAAFEDPRRQGSVIAFNVLKADGQHIPYAEVEKSANSAGIYIRSGGVCNPGGIFTSLGYEPWMMDRALSAGHHCGSHGIAIIHGLPTGIVRASVGAMTTKREIDSFLDFMRAVFVVSNDNHAETGSTTAIASKGSSSTLYAPSADNNEAMRMALDLPPVDLTGKYYAEVGELPRPGPRPLSHNPRMTSCPVIPLAAFPGLVRAGM